VPNRVRISPVSVRIGRSVPMAVVHERDDDPGRGQRAAERVGDHERQGPAVQGQPQRFAADARDVDLVAREEEQHPEPEVREELREGVDLGEAEDLRPDDDAEGQLDHDDGDEQVAPAGGGDDRRRHGRGHDDREERAGVDAERRRGQGCEGYGAHVGQRTRRAKPSRPAGGRPSPARVNRPRALRAPVTSPVRRGSSG
jgi:hypothetical protein